MVAAEIPYSELYAMPNKQGNLMLTVRHFLRSHQPNICSPNSGDCNPLIVMYEVSMSEGANTILFNNKDELKVMITAEFNNLDKEIVGKACRGFQSCLEAVFEDNVDFCG